MKICVNPKYPQYFEVDVSAQFQAIPPPPPPQIYGYNINLKKSTIMPPLFPIP